MSGYLWKATVRNVNRVLKEVNAFEWEYGFAWEEDYRSWVREALRNILENWMWRRVRTANLTERVFLEVKGRTWPMGVFCNQSIIERILFAFFYYQNYKGEKEVPLPFYRESLT